MTEQTSEAVQTIETESEPPIATAARTWIWLPSQASTCGWYT